MYHTAPQVLWGFGIGFTFGTIYYVLVELIPSHFPGSYLGRKKDAIMASQLFTWLRIRDGWSVWPDGGMDAQYHNWRRDWDKQRNSIPNRTKGKKKQF